MNREKILEILANVIEIDKASLLELPAGTMLSELGLDSLQFIRFVVALEEEFKIEILDSDLLISNFETIEMLFDTLKKYFLSENALKKVLVCDCDNVLWHGIAGEEEIHTDISTNAFQEAIIDLYNQGVIICLCSKNDPKNIEAAFDTLDMPLKEKHILLSKVNMTDKATNIKQIAAELNLSVDSFVFVDDSEYELDLVSCILPKIITIHVEYPDGDFIERVKLCFATNSTDIDRTQQYREQKEREKEKQQFATAAEFNASLETEVICALAVSSQAARIAELSQRTNQFNLSNARYSESEINSFIIDENYTVYTLSVSDKYGDMGIVGSAIIQKINKPVIIGFFLSCRVFGREFEKFLLDKVKSNFIDSLSGIYKKTEKNKRFEKFYAENGVSVCE